MLHKLTHKQWKIINKTVSTIVLLVLLTIIIFYVIGGFDSEKIKEIVAAGGVYGQLVYVLFMATSVVLAPIVSLPFYPVVLIAYGFAKAVILTFFASTAGSLIAFFIARRFGRPVVRKIIGEKSMKNVDEFTKVAGWKAFLVLRILGNISFDYVSYAIGLVKFDWRVYAVITAITNIFWLSFVFFTLDKAITIGGAWMYIIIGAAYILAVYGGIRVWRKYTKVKK